MARVFLVIGVLLVLAGVLWPSPDEPPPPQVDPQSLRYTTAGPVQGFRTGEDTFVWRGIPFAAPPQGDLRWRRPHLPEPWTEPREALEFAAPCVQFWSPLSGVPGAEGELVGSEDCLYLNI